MSHPYKITAEQRNALEKALKDAKDFLPGAYEEVKPITVTSSTKDIVRHFGQRAALKVIEWGMARMEKMVASFQPMTLEEEAEHAKTAARMASLQKAFLDMLTK